MKKYILLIIVLILSSCNNENSCTHIGFSGSGSATIKGKPWDGITKITYDNKKFCYPDSCFSIVIEYFEPNCIPSSLISLSKIPMEVGHFQFNNDLGIYYQENLDDLILGQYILLDFNPNNYINITEINLSTGIVKGFFQSKLVKYSLISGPMPDTINIEDGNFFGKINWK